MIQAYVGLFLSQIKFLIAREIYQDFAMQQYSVDCQSKMKECLLLKYIQFNVSLRRWFYWYWIFAVWKKLTRDFYSCKCLLCVQYIMQYTQNSYFRSILLYQSVAFCGFLVPFQRIIQHFSSSGAAYFPALFFSFLTSFCCSLPLSFQSFLQRFQPAPFVICIFILVVFFFLKFTLNFCLFQLHILLYSIYVNNQLINQLRTPFPDFSPFGSSNIPDAASTVVCKKHWAENFETQIYCGKERPKVPPSLFDCVKPSIIPTRTRHPNEKVQKLSQMLRLF